MINIMHSLQELSWPVKIQKIDLMHPFATNSRILIKEDEARINFSKDSYLEWRNGLGMFLNLTIV